MADKKQSKKELSIEESIEKLEEILDKMEQRDVALDDAFSLYEEGVKLLKSTNDKLDTVEKNVKTISENGSLDDFE